jgi:hypothetical protein
MASPDAFGAADLWVHDLLCHPRSPMITATYDRHV